MRRLIILDKQDLLQLNSGGEICQKTNNMNDASIIIMNEDRYELMYNKNKSKNNDDLSKNISDRSDSAKFHRVLHVIYTICEFAGFHIEERIVLKDKKTGRIWR